MCQIHVWVPFIFQKLTIIIIIVACDFIETNW